MTKPTDDNDKVEARPIGEGKDPLAEGNTLVNPSNTEAETHYEVKERSEDAPKTDDENLRVDGQDANERAERHNAESPQPSGENHPQPEDSNE